MFGFTVLYFQIDNLKIDFVILCRPALSGYIRKWCHECTSNWWSSLVCSMDKQHSADWLL